MTKPTVVAVLVFVPVDGAVRPHLQVEALLAEQSSHDPLQLLCYKGQRSEVRRSEVKRSAHHITSHILTLVHNLCKFNLALMQFRRGYKTHD